MAQKKSVQVVMRFSEEMLKILQKMAAQRKAATVSDYVRGLVLIDAGREDVDRIIGHDVPAWVTTDRRYTESMKAASRSRKV